MVQGGPFQGPHLGCGVSERTRRESVCRSGEVREAACHTGEWDAKCERMETLFVCSLFSASPCLSAQWILKQTDLDFTPHFAILELCDPRQSS